MYIEEKKRLNDMESKIADLEKGSRSINYEDIEISLRDMTLRLDNLEQVCNQETNKVRRDDARRRVASLRSAYSHVTKALNNYMKRRGKFSLFILTYLFFLTSIVPICTVLQGFNLHLMLKKLNYSNRAQ